MYKQSSDRTFQTRHLVDIYLTSHVVNLTNLIRSRALVMYFQPFASVKMENLSTAFGWSMEYLEQQIVSLIQAGEIQARIDKQNKVSISRHGPWHNIFNGLPIDPKSQGDGSTRCAFRTCNEGWQRYAGDKPQTPFANEAVSSPRHPWTVVSLTKVLSISLQSASGSGRQSSKEHAAVDRASQRTASI